MDARYLMLLLLLLRRRRNMFEFNRARPRRFGIHPLNRKRCKYGYYESLLPVLKSHPEKFHEFLRIDLVSFNTLLAIISPSLTKNSKRPSISAEERLMVTLRYLATGESFRSLAFQFRLGFRTVSNIVAESCEAIRLHLAPKYLKLHQQPKNGIELLQSSGKSGILRIQLLNKGAIDGKHILLKAPTNTGSLHYNYKDVGNYGKDSDGGIFGKCSFKEALDRKVLNLPEAKNLPGTDVFTPAFIVRDAAFPLRDNIMRPFPGNELDYGKRIFNYRLSRARRVIENFFGILSVKWRVLLSRIETSVEVSDKIVWAVLALHNFLIMEGKLNTAALADTGDENNGPWRTVVAPLLAMPQQQPMMRRCTASGKEVRQKLVDYYTNVGAVEWQDAAIGNNEM
uniref:DDE Tnp4 domain-containing protein n=1 Tax=Ditylenchus dipsaci TaxID=166011 RepID=A0A915D665_9BILA